MTGSGLALWLYMQMLQLARPAELVVAVHFWAVVPVPTVKVTVWPGSGVPPAVVSVADKLGGWPLVVVVLPV